MITNEISKIVLKWKRRKENTNAESNANLVLKRYEGQHSLRNIKILQSFINIKDFYKT